MPKNWKIVNKVLTFKEKFIVMVLFLTIIISFFVWIGSFYFNFTKSVPRVGGEYIEGIVGQPLYINPLLSQTSDADADLVQLIFDGLFKYDKDGNIVESLAQNYEISDDQKEYTVYLRKDLLWHDGKSLDANDALFTFNILQDPAYNSPLRKSLQGVEVSLIDNYTIKFTLKNAYVGFLEGLTVGLLPKHIWENIAPEKFALAENNLHPIGSGPYVFSDFKKNTDGNILTVHLVANKKYFNGNPYISKFTFNFYPGDEELIASYNKKEIMGMGSISPENVSKIKNVKSTNLYELKMPSYFSVFFNQTKNVALADDNVRKALSLSVNRQEIIEKILYGKGTLLTSPFLPQMQGYKDNENSKIDIETAKKILDDAGWIFEENEKVRKKNSKSLSFELVTLDYPELNQTAEILKQQWEKIGAEVSVKILTFSDLSQNYIRTREYDSMLNGQVIRFKPELYDFWHSSQKSDPGNNFSLFSNKDADSLLEDLRQQTDQDKRIENYQKFQDILAKEIPAIFLYSRSYLYPLNIDIKGTTVSNINNSSQRFVDINKWFIKTKRVKK